MKPILRLLGRFELASGEGKPLAISGARAQLLLARLALARGEGLDRAQLCAMLWGERPEAQARASLRQAIWTLRQELKDVPDALVTAGEVLRLDLSVMGLDVSDFERLAKSDGVVHLEAALALYRGEFLEGLDLVGLAPESDFLPERHRLRDLGLKVAGDLAGQHAKANAWEDVVRVARRGLTIDSFDETLHARLIEALQRLGRQREARDLDAAFRSRVQAELGLSLAPRPATPTLAVPATPLVVSALLPRRPAWAILAAGLTVAGLALAVAAGLWLKAPGAVPAEPASATSGLPSRNLEAYDHYLRAEAARRITFDDAKLREVMTGFRRAFTLDPLFADAYAGYALIALELWQRSLDLGTPSLSARIEAYDTAGQALAIDSGNARALVVLSRIQAEDGARANALATARHAVEQDPLDAEAHAGLALLLASAGDYTHARAELTLAQRLDPPLSSSWMLVFGQVAFSDGRYDSAIADLVSLWPSVPGDVQLLQHLTAALALQGRIRQAMEIKDRLLKVMPQANLRLLAARHADRRSPIPTERLIEGLRRAGLPEWPYGFALAPDRQLDAAALTALVAEGDWKVTTGAGEAFTLMRDGNGGLRGAGLTFVVRDATLCRDSTDGLSLREICGPVLHAAPGQSPESDYVFLAPDEIRYFSTRN
jgi:DNA-binding SARP family transcriptional activator/Tfp pilus assembly protein PilF